MARFVLRVVFGVLVCAAAAPAFAVETPTSSASAATDLFQAEADELVAVRYIPNDSRSAQVVVVNRTNRPLTLRLPANFVGVPVLAQMGAGGAVGGAGGGAQATGGGMMGGMGRGMGGMGGGMGGMGGMGGGAFSIPPERSRTIRVPTVCLEHGKPEPSPNLPYKLVKTDTFSSDPKLAVVLESLGRGDMPQKVAQAAAWHITNGLSWQRLAAEKIDRVGGVPDEPFFTPAELMAAYRAVGWATEIAAERAPEGSASPSPGDGAR